MLRLTKVGALRLSVGAVALATAFQTQVVLAQDTGFDLGTLVLQGERTATDILDTEASVTVIEEDELQRRAPESVYDLVNQAPNTTAMPNEFLPSIRGVNSDGPLGLGGNDLNGTSPRLTLIVDGVSRPIAYTNNGFQSVFDAEQVEIFRGPQTTLQGANALAGSVVVNTKDPVFLREGLLEFNVEHDEISGISTRTGFVFNDVLVEDELAYRAVLQYRDGAVPIDDSSQFGFGEEQREEDLALARLKLLWELEDNPDLSALFALEYQNGRVPAFQSFVTNDDREGGSQRVMDTEAWGATLDVRYQLGMGELRSITSFFSDQFESNPDSTDTFVAFEDLEKTRLNQDLTYSFENIGVVTRGLIGLTVQQQEETQRFGSFFNRQVDQDRMTAAVFGKVDIGLGSNWELGLGGRLHYERLEIDGASGFGPPPAAQTPVSFKNSDTEFLPDLSLTYDLDPRQSVFVSYRKGYNSGGYGVNLFTGDPFVFDAEFSDTYEIGYRGELMGGDLILTTTAFYNDFDGYHTYVFGPGGPTDYSIINLDGKSYGAEIEARARLSDTLQGTMGVGLLKTEVDAPDNANDGNRFGDDPEFTFNVGAVWTASPGLNFDAQANYQGSYFADFNETGPKAGNFWNLDLGVTYERDSFSVRGYVRNVFDDLQYTTLSDGGGGNVLDPRTVGFTVSYTF